MKERLIDDLMVATSSSLFTTDRIEKLLNDAYLWATGLYEWPELQKGYDTTTPAVEESTNEQYIDYPEDYRTDTITEFIYIDGKAFRRKSWMDFLEHKRLNPTATKRIFADYARQIFIFPHQTVGLEVCLWGQKQADRLTDDANTTIFSNHDEAGNEAVVDKAFSVAMKRVDIDASRVALNDAVTGLSVVWKKIADRQQYAQPLNKQMFNVPNLFPSANGGLVPRNFNFGLVDEG